MQTRGGSPRPARGLRKEFTLPDARGARRWEQRRFCRLRRGERPADRVPGVLGATVVALGLGRSEAFVTQFLFVSRPSELPPMPCDELSSLRTSAYEQTATLPVVDRLGPVGGCPGRFGHRPGS